MRLFVDPVATTCRPVLAIVSHLQVKLDVEEISLAGGEHLSPEYRARNPTAKVPFLQSGQFGLSESAAIARFLCDSAGSHLGGADLETRARVDERVHWCETSLAASFSLGLVYPRFVPALSWPDAAVARAVRLRASANAARAIEQLDREVLAQQAFTAGPNLTYADYFVLAVLELAPAIDYDLSGYPAVSDWMRRASQTPAWKAVSAPFLGFLSQLTSRANA